MFIINFFIIDNFNIDLHFCFNCDSGFIICSLPFIIPLKIYRNLDDTILLRKELDKKGGVYGILNTESSLQYIGSSLNLYSRLMDHIKGRESNIRLQRAIKKVG